MESQRRLSTIVSGSDEVVYRIEISVLSTMRRRIAEAHSLTHAEREENENEGTLPRSWTRGRERGRDRR